MTEQSKPESSSRAQGALHLRIEQLEADLAKAMVRGVVQDGGLFVKIVEQSPIMAVATDMDGKILYANPRFLNISGYSQEDVLDAGLPELLFADFPGRIFEAMALELRSGNKWRGRLRCRRKDGSEYWAQMAFSPLVDSKGRVLHFIGLGDDITEQIKGEEHHRRQETLLGIFYRMVNTVHTTRDLNELFRAIHSILEEYIDATNFFIALTDEGCDRLAFPYFKDVVDGQMYDVCNISDPKTKSLTLDVIRTGQPLLVRKEDLEVVSGLPGASQSGVVGTPAAIWLGVPLVMEGKTIGAMAVQDYQDPDHYGADDVDLMLAISKQVAMAIERKRMEEALRESEERYRMVSDSAFDMETWRAPDGRMLYVSPSCERITGYSPEMFMEDPSLMQRIIHRDDLPLWLQFMSREGDHHGEGIDFRVFREDGRMHWLSLVSRTVYSPSGACLGLRCSMRDITDRKGMEKQLRYESLHDSLTGLANRSLCLDRILQIMERAKRKEGGAYAVLFLDIDRFKVVNDSLGHSVGDALLKEVSYRLLRCVRSLDTVSRYAGDEFIVLLDELESPREAIVAAKRIRTALAEPFSIGDHEISITVSLGIVLTPSPGSSPQDVLRNANIAMHHAMESGGGRLRVFTPRMLAMALETMTLESDLRRALSNQEFFLCYQPIVSLREDRLMGFEALVRWRHPTRGVLAPGQFIPAAEDSGQIIDLGLYVLREACATMASWLKNYPRQDHLHMSVNLSARQFSQPVLVDQIACILDETGLPASSLKLEITESTIMENAENALTMLRRLKASGVRLSIDDFGTGYSSLSYLQKFPVDTLKVDRSFISGMGENAENTAIVRAVVVLAKSMGLDVVAEGVEEHEQMTLLKGLDCDNVQGFFFSRPLETQDALQLVMDATG